MHDDRRRVQPPAHPPVRSARRPEAPPHPLIGVQRSAGNQAAAALVRQRAVATYRAEHESRAKLAALRAFATHLDESVHRAWTIVTSRPLTPIERVDGYTERWSAQWARYAAGGDTVKRKIAPQVPMMAGYAIESLATRMLMKRSWPGFIVALQDTHGKTRPDVVLYDRSGEQLAWFDVTSSGSEGHIMDKDGRGWRTRPMVAEILYEPVRAEEVAAAMAAYVADGSPELASYGAVHRERYARERAKFALLTGKAAEMVKERLSSVAKDELSRAARRQKLREELEELRGAPLTQLEAASVVKKVYGRYANWGFSRPRSGERFFVSWVWSASGQVLLQQMAAHQEIKVTRAEIRDYLGGVSPRT